uniref:Glycosyl transferase family 1 domain-containing protein n=1 Tax=viral metagenome TaxID=1070528 RepID=A0A6C0H5T1_9ZZZZ
MLLEINKKKYHICPNEYNVKIHPINNNLIILSELGEHERIIGLLNELSEKIEYCIINGPTHGGFIAMHLNYKRISLINVGQDHLININKNIEMYDKKEINFKENKKEKIRVMYNENGTNDFDDETTIHVSLANIKIIHSNKYKIIKLTNSALYIHYPLSFEKEFEEIFGYYKKNNELNYNNLFHFCMIIKDGGEKIRNVLRDNKKWIDRWTIVDTGSVDDTKEIIMEELGDKNGKLYEIPFIDFKKNRNDCLELAGTKCKYTVMLDDTYVINGDIISFFNEIRGDQFGDSYSLFIKSGDTTYTSNRIIKTDRNLRYIYRIHEVIEPKNNKNVIIPQNSVYIYDIKTEKFNKRTMERKKWDLEMLKMEINDDPNEPRHYYYVAQTYNLLGEYELAYEYFMKRYNHKNDERSFIYEKIDALFEATRIANFRINRPRSECLEGYLKVIEMDKTRPDAYYYVGIYYLDENPKMAYKYLKEGFQLGYPEDAQYSVRPTIYYYYIPSLLVRLCFENNENELGKRVCEYFMEKYELVKEMINDENPEIKKQIMMAWNQIYSKVLLVPNKLEYNKIIFPKNLPIFVIVADGGWKNWTGSDIDKDGMGGSETFIVEIAQYLVNNFQVFVFCRCLSEENYKNVTYLPIELFANFISTNYIQSCLISRYSEYLVMAYKGLIENIYFILHDLEPSINILVDSNKLKKIFCLTKWHVEYFLGTYSIFKKKTLDFSYGINSKFIAKDVIKKPNSFIYSSFPNRGLLPLLKMWDKIVEKYPSATLSIYCDLEHEWVKMVSKESLVEIKKMLEYLPNVKNYGWVNKEELSKAWKESEYWLYPCIFLETFCLTALECAASKTVAITSKLGALNDTVNTRGLMIEGDANTEIWQKKCLNELFKLMGDSEKKKYYIKENYRWALKNTWKKRAKDLLENYLLVDSELEYKFMGNWTNDIPLNSKIEFEKNMDLMCLNVGNNGVNILEVGTYSGTSLVNIARHIKNIKEIYVIDIWENYKENEVFSDLTCYIKELRVEESFYKNIAKIDKPVNVYKGKTVDMLLQLIKENKIMDFIYLDASHHYLDCIIDLTLCWKILNNGGYIIIDDVLSDKNLVDSVEYFIKSNKVNIISNQYRVCLEKKE